VKVLTGLITPAGFAICGLAIAGLLAFFRSRRLAYLTAALAISPMIVLSFTPVADALLLPLESQARADAAAAPPCCYGAIVVLCGGIDMDRGNGDPELGNGASRMWHAARLYHQGIAPRVIVSGRNYVADKSSPVQSATMAMRQFLVDLGVPAEHIVMEDRSLNTLESIREVQAMAQDERVALVTSGFHMPRAMRLAHRAHLKAEAFPTDWRAKRRGQSGWFTYLPSPTPLQNATAAIKEHMALAFDIREGAVWPPRRINGPNTSDP
jgi:uncharacterized SAM-binding protein YcdF (DUF218 family)